MLSRKEHNIDRWIDDKQGKTVDLVMSAGKRGIAAAASGAMSGVAQLQTHATDQGLSAGVLLSGVTNTLGNLATMASTPTVEENVDETFEELSDTLSSTDLDEDYDDSERDDTNSSRMTTRSRGKQD